MEIMLFQNNYSKFIKRRGFKILQSVKFFLIDCAYKIILSNRTDKRNKMIIFSMIIRVGRESIFIFFFRAVMLYH